MPALCFYYAGQVGVGIDACTQTRSIHDDFTAVTSADTDRFPKRPSKKAF